VSGRLLSSSPALKELTILIRRVHLSEVRQLDVELWIVQGGGKRIARLASTLTRAEAEEAGRIIRQARVLVETCREASRRLAKAQHPNAKALRALVHGALQGLELPLDDQVPDRIDP